MSLFKNNRKICLLLPFQWIFIQSFSIACSRIRTSTRHLRDHRQLSAAPGDTESSPFTDSVQVFDNVFSPDVCAELHYLAAEHSDRCGVRSSIFYWKDKHEDDALLTPLEQALQSCLQQMPNENPTLPAIVEYWSRDEYLNMDTHSDIDEQELLNEGTLRCPTFGHVLYLEVAPSIRGPTCVFSQNGGWGGEDGSQDASSTSLVTVPAVQGRVLRFPGAAMHAVPKPSALWFLDKEDQSQALVDDEEDIDDDSFEDEDDDAVQRSVILFNVWKKEGPLGVVEDLDAKGMLPSGIELIEEETPDDDGNDSYTNRQTEERRAIWEEDYGTDCSDLWCHPQEEWQEMQIAENNQDATSCCETILVPLMGNKARRLCPKSHVLLSAPAALEEALQDSSTPHHLLLKGEPI